MTLFSGITEVLPVIAPVNGNPPKEDQPMSIKLAQDYIRK